MRPVMVTMLVLTLPTMTSAADLPSNDAVKPVEVLRTGDFSEGVVVDHEGNLFISRPDASVIVKVSPDGKKSEVWARTPAPNGHKILADGTHLICDRVKHAVLHLDADGREMAPAATESDDKSLTAPNDLCLDPEGGFYFTDPAESNASQLTGSVHYVTAHVDGVAHAVATDLAFPNGIVLRPSGKELLVGESQKNRILAFPVLSRGKLGKPRVLVDLPTRQDKQFENAPDGMALDDAGNLYVAHFGMGQVQVVSPEGKVIRRFDGGNRATSNVAFAGKDLDQLFVTGGEPGTLFRLDLGIRGLAILPPRTK